MCMYVNLSTFRNNFDINMKEYEFKIVTFLQKLFTKNRPFNKQ